jgi:hypothetical protein
LISIIASTVDFVGNRVSLTLFVVGVLTLHSSILGGYEFGADDLRYVFTGGIANKSMFHSYLTPDTFSVFILCSIALYLRGYAYAAVAANAVACTFHAHYFLPALLITVSYLVLHWGDKKSTLSVVALGSVALVLVLPILAYNVANFAPTAPEVHERAVFIFNHLRIPHHVDPHRWMDVFVAVKGMFVIVVFVLFRNTRLSVILMPLLLAIVVLTILQFVLANEDLAYLLPWRHVAFLVPVATAFLLAVGARALSESLSCPAQRLLVAAAVVWLGFLIVTGSRQLYAVSTVSIPYVNENQRPLMEHVREHGRSGQLFLIPLRMQEFRLAAGVPVFVDWKTVPFGDVAVLEWYRRYQLADSFYKSPPHRKWAMLEKLTQEEGITHVVLPGDTVPELRSFSRAKETFRSQSYIIYEIDRGGRQARKEQTQS